MDWTEFWTGFAAVAILGLAACVKAFDATWIRRGAAWGERKGAAWAARRRTRRSARRHRDATAEPKTNPED